MCFFMRLCGPRYTSSVQFALNLWCDLCFFYDWCYIYSRAIVINICEMNMVINMCEMNMSIDYYVWIRYFCSTFS
jgi:hypothetical protein